MQVSDLLSPQYGLQNLVSGEDREIRWVCTTDLLDPSPYLSGHELVLTSEAWYREDADCVRFVEALVSSGAAALVAGDVVHGEVPAALVEACRERGLPLLFAPPAVAYGALSERIERSLLDERGDAVLEALTRQRQLVSLLAGGGGIDAMLDVLRKRTSAACWAQSITGRVLGRAGAVPGPDRRLALADQALRAVRLPVVVDGPCTVLGIGQRSARLGFLVVAADLTDPDGPGHALADTVAELLVLGRDRFAEAERRKQAAGREAVAALDAARTPRARAAALAELGVDTAQPALVVSLTTRGTLQPWDLAIDLVASLDGRARLAIAPDDEIVGIVPGGAAAAARLTALVAHLRPHLRTGTVHVGSALADPGTAALVHALAQARLARELAVDAGTGPVVLVESAAMDSHLMVLAAAPEATRRAFRRRVLGPLDDIHPAPGVDLLHTLAVFLDRNGSWQRAAADLHIHVSTLHGRIERVEKILGRDFGTARDRVDCFLALRCPA